MWLGPTYQFSRVKDDFRLYAKYVIEFRKTINPYIAEATYVDDKNVTITTEGIVASRWESVDKDVLIISNANMLIDGKLSMKLDKEPKEIKFANIDGNSEDICITLEPGVLQINIRNKRLFYIVISY